MYIILALASITILIAAISIKRYDAQKKSEKEVADRIAEAKTRAAQRAANPGVDFAAGPWATSVSINNAIWATELGGTGTAYNELTPAQQEIINRIFSEAGIDTVEIVKPAPEVSNDPWANARD